MDRKTVFKMVIEYFKDNEEEYIRTIETLDGYNGYLGDDRYYEMEDLFESITCACGSGHNMRERQDNAEKIVRLIYFGHDADHWHLDAAGEKFYSAFNPNRNYYTYGNNCGLVSTDTRDYSDKLDEYFVDELYENSGHLYLPTEVEDLFELVEE